LCFFALWIVNHDSLLGIGCVLSLPQFRKAFITPWRASEEQASNHSRKRCTMSDLNNKTPMRLPPEKTSKKIEEPFDPDSPSDDEDDSEGQPDQPDGDK
jgi:hypothetical protein